jgi:hypothetical protein
MAIEERSERTYHVAHDRPIDAIDHAQLLASDGAVSVAFTPALNVDKYTELYGIATGDYGTCKEPSGRIKIKANEWGVQCQVDGC